MRARTVTPGHAPPSLPARRATPRHDPLYSGLRPSANAASQPRRAAPVLRIPRGGLRPSANAAPPSRRSRRAPARRLPSQGGPAPMGGSAPRAFGPPPYRTTCTARVDGMAVELFFRFSSSVSSASTRSV